MKLFDMEAAEDYILDGKYAVKAGTDYLPVSREIKRVLAQLAQKQSEIGQPCYKIYLSYPNTRRKDGMYDYICDSVRNLKWWKEHGPDALNIRERPFTKSDRAHLGKTVFWTREEAEQAIKRSEQAQQKNEHGSAEE